MNPDKEQEELRAFLDVICGPMTPQREVLENLAKRALDDPEIGLSAASMNDAMMDCLRYFNSLGPADGPWTSMLKLVRGVACVLARLQRLEKGQAS